MDKACLERKYGSRSWLRMENKIPHTSAKMAVTPATGLVYVLMMMDYPLASNGGYELGLPKVSYELACARGSNEGTCPQSNPSEHTPTLEDRGFCHCPKLDVGARKISSLPPIYHPQEHYKWVNDEVKKYQSVIPPIDVKVMAKGGGWVERLFKTHFKMSYCSPNERIWFSVKDGSPDFIYMYETFFRDLRVTFPFDSFAAGVL
ncbi:hypothetical protein CR513_42252, partial [Mucuna pruriens]